MGGSEFEASSASPGEGWWLASDGNWYPPEQASGVSTPPPVPPGTQPPSATPPLAARANTAAVAALVLGIVGAFFGITVFFFWLAWILGLLAFVFGRIGRRRAKEGLGRDRMATAGWTLGLVAFILGIGAFALLWAADDNSVPSRLDRIDTANGIKVAITSCEAQQLQPTDDGIPQTAYTAKGTVANTSGDPRLHVTVHVSFRDGDKEFYDSDIDDVLSFGGKLAEEKKDFSFSVTLSDEVTDLQCKGSAAS